MHTDDKIPQQETGSETNTESSITLNSLQEAGNFYTIVKQRLLNVNDWQKIAGAATARFQLTDNKGRDVQRTIQKEDYFKIDIPGPGTVTGEGHDWVQVESVEEDHTDNGQSVVITVRPAANPTESHGDIAHFFDNKATSTFIVKQRGTTVSAGVYGRNEKPNTDTETIIDKIRNTITALGAQSAFSKLQWKSLVNGFVKKDEE